MIATLTFDIDSENSLNLMLTIPTANGMQLTHISGLTLDTDPLKAFLKLFKRSVSFDFENILATASDEVVAKAQADEEAKKIAAASADVAEASDAS